MDFKSQAKALSRQIGVYLAISCLIFNLHIRTALAGPEGAQVVSGQVGFQQSGYNTTITASDKAIVNYSSFDIARPETVQFIQPSRSASVLNRILSANPTNINGTLLANGRVFFVNPAGVYIGNGARINVAQLVASSLNISNSDFIGGQYNFAGGIGSVINSGDISAEKVYLIGKQVANFGNISCPAGYVVMASGDRVFLGETGSDVVVEIDVPSLPEPVEPIEGSGVLNEGTIEVGDGAIILAAAGDIYSQAISNVGTLSASSDTGDAGQVKLTGTDGTVINSGSIEAKSSSGTSGTVQVLGDKVGLFGTGQIDVSGSNGGGTVLVGGDYKGEGDVPTASRTYVSSDSTIKADAIENGDGGKVIVWSDEITGFYGSISARGGADGGDGGFVEVSGKDNLGFYGHVDTLAPQGDMGTLLLDPLDILVSADGTDGDSGGDILFAENPAENPWNVSPAQLDGVGGNIILEARDDLYFDSAVSLSTDGAGITGRAGDDITINESITTRGGSLDFTANDSGGTQSGDGIIKIEGALDTTGGSQSGGPITLTIDGGTGWIRLNYEFITTNAADITFEGPVELEEGLTISTTAGVGGTIAFQDTVNGDATAFFRDLRLTAGTGNIDFYGILGGTCELDDVTIYNAADVTFHAAFSGDSFKQEAGTGDTQFDGAVTLRGVSTAFQLTTNTVTINSTIDTQNDGIVTITNTGLLDIAADADMSLGGAFTQNGAGAVQTAGDITTTNDNINFLRAVTLTDGHAVAFDTGSGGAGTITFQSTLDGTTDFAEDLSLTAGAGNIDFDGIVGGTKDLGNVTIANAADVTTDAAFNANNLTQSAGTGTTQLGGVTTVAGGLAVSTGTIDIDNDITAGTTIALTSTADEGLISIAAGADVESTGGAHTYTADKMDIDGTITATGQTVTLKAESTIDNDSIDLSSATDLQNNTLEFSDAELDNITATTIVIGETGQAGPITVVGEPDISPDNAANLHLISNSTVTASQGGFAVANLAIEAAGAVMITDGTVDVDTLAIDTSTGSIQFDDADSFSVGTVDGVAGVATGSGTVKLTAHAGDLTVTNTAAADDVGATGRITLRAYGDEKKLTIAAGAHVESTGDSHYYIADKMDIAGTITATGQMAVLYPYTSSDAIDVGSTTDLQANTLELSDAELDNITASELRIGETGKTGAITISANISPDNTTDTLRLKNDSTVTINGDIDTLTAGNGCGVRMNNGGLIDIAAGADMTLDGRFLQYGAGAVQTAGDITTTGDNITFEQAVTLTDGHAVAFDTGAGAGDITFESSLNGTTDFAEDLSLTVGAGNISFSAVGSTRDLGDVTIVSAADVTAGGAFNANTLTQQAGTGDTQFDGAVTLAGAGGIQLTTNTVTINSTIDTLTGGNGGIVTITNAGLLDIAAGADMSLDGAFTQNGAGAVQTAGDITTTDDNISFLRAVTLDGDVDIDTGAGAGNITFQSTLDGTTALTENLTLAAGTGDITFSGIVGGGTVLGDVTVNSADDVQIQAAFNANNIVITTSAANIDIDDDVTTAGDIELNNNVDAADGVTLTAGNDLKLDAGQTVTGGGDLTLVATAGGITEKTGDDDIFQINMAADDKTLTLTQNDALDMANFAVTNDEDTYLVANSTGSSVTSTAAGSWKSIAANASGDLTLTNLNNSDPITIGNLTSGGEIWVQSIADLTAPAGVTLTANGTYSAATDDRSRVYFQTDGDPIDVAIYLASYDFTTQTGGNATVNSAVSMANNGTMVIDAYDTVNTFGSNFTGSAAWSNTTNRLEVVSRISQSLDDAINNNRLPYASKARGGEAPSWFNGEKYVLRGRKPLAEVLAAVESTPVASTVSVVSETSSSDPNNCSEVAMWSLLQWLTEELGEETAWRMYLVDAYVYSTDLRPYKVAARLMKLAAILEDANPTELLASAGVVGKFVGKPPSLEEQIAPFKSTLLKYHGDGTLYDRIEWLDAMATYVSILNNEVGWSSERSIGFVMSKYCSELDMTSVTFVEMYLNRSAVNNKQYPR